MTTNYKEIENKIKMDLKIDKSLLFRASENGDLKLLKLLLSSKYIKPEADNNLAIFYGFYSNNFKICTYLFKYKIVQDMLKEQDEDIYNKIQKIYKIEAF